MNDSNIKYARTDLLNNLFTTFLTDDVIDTKRFDRHRNNYRKRLNEYIVHNFMVHLEDNSYMDIIGKNDENEPLFVFIRDGVLGYYNSICSIELSETSEEKELKKLGFKSLFTPHSFQHAYSLVEDLLLQWTNEYQDTLREKVKDSVDEIHKKYKPIIADFALEKNGAILNRKDHLLMAYAIDLLGGGTIGLLDMIADEVPALDKYLTYIANSLVQIDHNTPCFMELFNITFEHLFEHYIKLKVCSDPNINIDNYVTFTKLDDEPTMVHFLLDLISYCKMDAEHTFAKIFAIFNCNDMIKKVGSSLESIHEKHKEELQDSYSLLAETKCNLEESNRLVDRLNRTLDQAEKDKKLLSKSVLVQKADYSKQIKDLQKQIEELQDKYDDLNNYTKLIESEDINFDDDVEIDTNKRYVFVSSKGTENYSTIKNIQETFPNSVIKFGNFNVQAESTDAVIFLTFYLEHSIYYDLKNQCKGKNIPIVHCNKRDITDIKKAIYQCFNRKELI